jgi:microcystin-dependent protein
LGEIRIFGFNFAPRSWAKCDGALLPISQNQSLFSLLGTTYGGDGRNDFALPDLRGRTALHQGHGAGLTDRRIGRTSGSETETLTVDQLPSHNHSLHADVENADQTVAVNTFLATAREDTYGTSASTTMAAGAIGSAGGGQSHNNMQPYLVLNWCIALTGLYPSRS